MIEAIFFYAFAAVLLASAAMVISARNPVHSVLFLILAFFNAAGLFVMLGAEFIAMILVIVYVGAVAVLFLFVVMMLDIDFREMRRGMKQHAPVGALVGAVLLGELVWMYLLWPDTAAGAAGQAAQPIPLPESGISNTHALGLVLYTEYVFLFQIAGLILLVAMIGAIVLTHRESESKRRMTARRKVSRPLVAAVAEQVGLPRGAYVVAGLAVGHPDPDRPAEVKPRLPQSVVLHHERWSADGQADRIARYDDHMRDFRRSQGLTVTGWSQMLRDRFRDVTALRGRDQLVAILRRMGFALR